MGTVAMEPFVVEKLRKSVDIGAGLFLRFGASNPKV
jgi:hypothetical protein